MASTPYPRQAAPGSLAGENPPETVAGGHPVRARGGPYGQPVVDPHKRGARARLRTNMSGTRASNIDPPNRIPR
jgi:hypothetical protein